MRLVLDTNVVVSGLIWGGPPRELLNLARKGRVVLFSSGVLLDELASVLERDKFAAFLAPRDVTPTFLMRRYGILATLVKPTRITRTVPADADDDHVIAAASAARADVIANGRWRSAEARSVAGDSNSPAGRRAAAREHDRDRATVARIRSLVADAAEPLVLRHD